MQRCSIVRFVAALRAEQPKPEAMGIERRWAKKRLAQPQIEISNSFYGKRQEARRAMTEQDVQAQHRALRSLPESAKI